MTRNYTDLVSRITAFRVAGLLFLLFLSKYNFGQNGCNLVVDAGDNVTICEGENTQLQAVLSGGNNPQVIWTPAQGLSDPLILNPVAGPGMTTVYTITASDISDNLIVNGNFEDQTILPSTTQYTLAPDPISIGINAPNYYAILDVPQIVQTFGCNPDIGLYTMVLHGSTGVSVNFWCQTVNVTPNRSYTIRYKVFGIPYIFFPAPVIVAKINGQQVGSVTAPNSPCGVVEGEFTWNSGASTTADICFANSRVASLGSMCAIDDIEFYENCEVSDQVTVTVETGSEETVDAVICPGDAYEVGGQFFSTPGSYTIQLQNVFGCDSIIHLNLSLAEVFADIQISNPLNCLFEEAVLTGDGSSGTFGINSYSWSTLDGTILSDPAQDFVSIGSGGTYTLVVTTTDGVITCSDTLDLFVPIDTLAPDFYIEEPPQISCQDSVITLLAVGNDLPPFISIIWTATNGGNILSGGNTLEPVVNRTGTYSLTIINNENGCIGFDQVLVTGSSGLPVISLVELQPITCLDTTGSTCVAVNLPADDIDLIWTTADGTILSGADSVCMTFGAGGLYVVTVTSKLNGCRSRLELNAEDLRSLPAVTIESPDTLDCQRRQVWLRASVNPVDTALLYSWVFEDGSEPNGGDSLAVLVDKGGFYWLRITHPTTGCRDSALVQVAFDSDFPVASAGPDLLINCAQPIVYPTSGASSSGPQFSYRWTLAGNPIDSSDLLSPPLSEAGTYILTVLNAQNACEMADTIIVEENFNTPEIIQLLSDTLTCIQLQIDLSFDAVLDEHASAFWTNSAGVNINFPFSVILPGTYRLILLDSLSQCADTAFVDIIQNREIPEIRIEDPEVLNCQLLEIDIAAADPPANARFRYQWSTQSGFIVGNADGRVIRVNRPGWYYLLVTDEQNGCEAIDSVQILAEDGLPQLDIAEPLPLTCARLQVTLQSSHNITHSQVGYQWSTIQGQISGSSNGSAIIALASAWYYLVFTDSLTGCVVSDSVFVGQETDFPSLSVLAPDELSCQNTQVTLTVLPEQNAGDFVFLWSTSDGSISGNPDLDEITVTQAGTYQVIVRSLQNGCADTVYALVTADTLRPMADAGPDRLGPCGQLNIWLDGSSSSGPGTLAYSWFTPDGNIDSASDSAFVLVTSTGTYILRVVSDRNGCTDSDTVELRQQAVGTIGFELEPPPCPEGNGAVFVRQITGLTKPVSLQLLPDTARYDEGDTLAMAVGQRILRITDANGCSLDTIITMPVGSLLQVTHPDSLRIVPGQSGTFSFGLNLSNVNIVQVLWSPSGAFQRMDSWLNWTFINAEAGIYEYEMVTKEGCILRGQVKLYKDSAAGGEVFVPSAFTPSNKDGVNDRFYVLHEPGLQVDIHRMEVFNRWGARVFQQMHNKGNDESFGWDGSFKGQALQPGIYLWVLEYSVAGGERTAISGEVTLY
jgi:gliding motility-associated-like protein